MLPEVSFGDLIRRYGPLLSCAFACGFGLAVGVVRGFDWFNESLDNALRLGRE